MYPYKRHCAWQTKEKKNVEGDKESYYARGLVASSQGGWTEWWRRVRSERVHRSLVCWLFWDVSGPVEGNCVVVLVVVVVVVTVFVIMRRSSYVNYYVLCLVCWILLGITGKIHFTRVTYVRSLSKEGSSSRGSCIDLSRFPRESAHALTSGSRVIGWLANHLTRWFLLIVNLAYPRFGSLMD